MSRLREETVENSDQLLFGVLELSLAGLGVELVQAAGEGVKVYLSIKMEGIEFKFLRRK